MTEPTANKKRSAVEAPMVGCIAGGCVIPVLWVLVGAIAYHDAGSPGAWPVMSIILAPIGLAAGLVFNGWKNRNIGLSDGELAAELKSMTMESLLEYKELCRHDPREHALADAELERRARTSIDPPANDQ